MRSPVQYVPSPLQVNEMKTPSIYGSNANPMYQGSPFNFTSANNLRNIREEPMQTDVYMQGEIKMHSQK